LFRMGKPPLREPKIRVAACNCYLTYLKNLASRPGIPQEKFRRRQITPGRKGFSAFFLLFLTFFW
jgi:hypothetical protein